MFKAFDTFWFVLSTILDTICEIVSTSGMIIKSFLRGLQAIAEEFEKETTKGLKQAKGSKKKKAA